MYTSNSDTYLHQLKAKERKFNKHLIEKRRRGRINTALDELKALVMSGLQRDPHQNDKMEKADILELTVQYMAQITSQSVSHGMSNKSNSRATNYQSGYEACLNEVNSFLGKQNSHQHNVSTRLVGHLESSSCHQDLMSVTSCPDKTSQCISPVSTLSYNTTTAISPVGQYNDYSLEFTRRQSPGTSAEKSKNVTVWRPWEAVTHC